MVEALGVEISRPSKDERSWVVVGENRIDLGELLVARSNRN